MKHYDAIIIGGGPSGLITGITGKKLNPDSSYLMIKKDDKGLVPCGIPYVFHDLDGVEKNQMGPKGFINAGGKVLVDTVENVNLEEKSLSTKGGNELSYDKLVFATGSVPVIPKFIKGYALENVEVLKKNYHYIKNLREKVVSAKNIVVVGAGFIGVELSEQFAKHKDKTVSLIEVEDHCLSRAFSKDFAKQADEMMEKANVNLYTGTKAEEFIGENGKVTGVKLENGKTIKADIVISSVGYTPNTELAEKAGLEIDHNKAIRVDNYLRTSEKNVFAVGDCSQTIGFITGRTDNIMLASTATAEARVLGYNMSKISLLRNFAGTLSVFSTEIAGKAFASAGAIEQTAHEADVDFVIGRFKAADRHPGTLPGTSKLDVKLIVSPENGEIIGSEITGGKSVGEMINIVSLAIQKAVTVYELVSFQIGTHPLLTTAPTKYILIKAAEDAMSNIKKSR